MINRVILKTALVLAAMLVLFLPSTQANWHWYYLRIQQHHAMVYHYQQQLHQHHMNVYMHQVHQLHQLNHIHNQIHAHMQQVATQQPVMHVQQRLQHYRHTGIQHIQPRRVTHHEMEHERKETHLVLRPHHVHAPGRCFHPHKPWEIHIRTVHEDWKKKTTHHTIHQPPRHTTTEFRHLVTHLKKTKPEPKPKPQPEEHKAREEKTVKKVKTHQDRVTVVRSREKTEYRHGMKEWDTYLLVKVYYWTDDGQPRALPKRRPDLPKPLPKPLAKMPPRLPVSLPVARPDLPRTLPKPGPHPIDKAIQRHQETPRLAMSVPKPARPLPERFAHTAPKMPSPLPVTIPTPQPVRKRLPEIVRVRMMLVPEDVIRMPGDFLPLFPAVFEPGEPAAEKPAQRDREQQRVAKGDPVRERAADRPLPGLFLPAMRDAEDHGPRLREPSPAPPGDEKFGLLLPSLRPGGTREREENASISTAQGGDTALRREREPGSTGRDENWGGLTFLNDGNGLAPLFPPAAASMLRLPVEG